MSTEERSQVLGDAVIQLRELLADQKCLRLKIDDGRPMLAQVLEGLDAQHYGGRFLPSLDILIRDDFIGTLKEIATIQERIDRLRSVLDI